ncbi:MAG: glycosyltransferase family 4 protein [Solirubrobacterales bacterium]|nr:glycosyltransferase family 4 protein [Solirubrobacterales bacterium]
MEEGAHSTRRIALVHDFLVDVRGAERVFLALAEHYPDADIFTAVHDPVGMEHRFAGRTVHTTFLQRLRPTARTFRALLPLYPYAIESLDMRGYDVVISSSSAWAHGVIADEDAVHVCYCHNPFRYAWNAREQTLARAPLPLRPVLAAVLSRWRVWDTVAAARVDRYVANSPTTARRVRRYLGRDAVVVPPPVALGRFEPGPVGEEYVVLSELMPHKRIDVAVRAFTALGLPLTVIGKGPDLRRLQRLAGPTVTFAGHLEDVDVAGRLAAARALVVTATEEFGIAAVEAQASGRPVIALREGGVRETVLEGVTGVFFDTPEPDALAQTVRDFDTTAIDPEACARNAARFSTERFTAAIALIVDEALRGDVDRLPGPGERRRPPRRSRGLAASA